jgi:two-component system OmpR family response regulator
VTEQVLLGDLCLNRLTRRVTRGGQELDLTPMEMRLLEHLMLRAGHIVTRGELHDKVWDMHFDPSSNLVDAHVARLRKKFNLAKAGVTLTTRRGMGFVLDRDGDEVADQDEYGLSSANV